MDGALMFAMYALGMMSGVLIARCFVSDRELQKYCDDTEHGVGGVK